MRTDLGLCHNAAGADTEHLHRRAKHGAKVGFADAPPCKLRQAWSVRIADDRSGIAIFYPRRSGIRIIHVFTRRSLSAGYVRYAGMKPIKGKEFALLRC